MGNETTIQDHSVRLAVFENSLKDNTTDTKEILTLLKGDNGEGLVTRVAVNDEHARGNIYRLWWAIPILFAVATTVVSYIVKYC
jgi:hypothetical protein